MTDDTLKQLKIIAQEKETEYLAFKTKMRFTLEHLQTLRLAMQETRDEYMRQRLVASPQPGQSDGRPIPKPMAIKSAIKKVKEVCAEILAVPSPVAAISVKDPRSKR